jgi:hypothetical protein
MAMFIAEHEHAFLGFGPHVCLLAADVKGHVSLADQTARPASKAGLRRLQNAV